VTLLDVLVGIAIAIGIAGIIVPVLPGTLLILGAVLVWAVQVGTTTGWVVFAVATTLLAAGTVVKYLVPGRRLKASGVPNRTLLVGAILAFIGVFVIPVVGMFIGFVLGVYVAERARVGGSEAWPSTVAALKAVGVSMLIELVAAALAAITWVVGVATT
jgi:uncharacterized protein